MGIFNKPHDLDSDYGPFYSVEIYKKDMRCKSKEHLLKVEEHIGVPIGWLENLYRTTYPASSGYRYEFHNTYVTRKNLMSGEEFQERYDTPHCCSPANERYWCM